VVGSVRHSGAWTIRSVAFVGAVLAFLVGYTLSHPIGHHQMAEDYRHMGEHFGQSKVVRSATPQNRPSICSSGPQWLAGRSHRSDERVAAFFEGCSGLDSDD
jgi:hypothetical protein